MRVFERTLIKIRVPMNTRVNIRELLTLYFAFCKFQPVASCRHSGNITSNQPCLLQSPNIPLQHVTRTYFNNEIKKNKLFSA